MNTTVRSRRRSDVACLLALASATGWLPSASAADLYYLGAQYTPGPGYPVTWPTEGSYFDPNNWLGNAIPTSTATAIFGSDQPMPNGNTTNAPHTIHFGNFGYYGTTVIPGGTGSLTTATILKDRWTFDFGSGQNPDFTGTLTPSTGSLAISASLTITAGTGQTASLELHNGSLTTELLNIGFQGQMGLAGSAYLGTARSAIGSAGAGNFVQSGGTHTISNYFELGSNLGAAGVYTLADGLMASSSLEYLGYAGSGTYLQTGGTHTLGQLLLATNFGSSGSYVLSGGLLAASISVSVGVGAAGIFTHTAGTHTVVMLTLGTNSLGSGTYTLSGGFLNSKIATIGRYGIGSFTQTDGTHSLSKLILGSFVNSLGMYSLSDSAVFSSADVIVGGYYSAGGTGTLAISGGTATIANTLKLWNTTNSTITLSGGTLAVGTLDIAAKPAGFGWTGGTLLINGPSQAPLTVPVACTLGGTGTLTGNLTNTGTLTPGNSPGLLTVQGNYTQSATATLLLEIAGTAPTAYDRLQLTGSLTLGGIVALDFLPGYVPALGDSFDFIDWTDSLINNSYTFDFTQAPIPSNFAWDTSAFSATGVITIVPEPTSLALLSVGVAGILLKRRGTRRRTLPSTNSA